MHTCARVYTQAQARVLTLHVRESSPVTVHITHTYACAYDYDIKPSNPVQACTTHARVNTNPLRHIHHTTPGIYAMV